MPHVNPDPRNLADLIEHEGMETAVELRNRGYSGQRLRNKLSALYPNAFHQSIRALADRSIQARRAAKIATNTPDPLKVDPATVPQLPGAEPGVTGTFEIQYTPEQTGEPRPLRVEITSMEKVTIGEAFAMARAMLMAGEFKYPERLSAWVRKRRAEAARGDESAREALRRFEQKIDAGQISILEIIKGQES